MNSRLLRFYRFAGLAMAVTFAVVGLFFLFEPDGVLAFFNRFSLPLGFSPSPAQAGPFFPVLAIAYMVLVTLLAGAMFRKPGQPLFSLLLAQAKLASSLLSLAFFLGSGPYLVCLANAVVDGAIGLLVLRLYVLQKRDGASWPTCP